MIFKLVLALHGFCAEQFFYSRKYAFGKMRHALLIVGFEVRFRQLFVHG